MFVLFDARFSRGTQKRGAAAPKASSCFMGGTCGVRDGIGLTPGAVWSAQPHYFGSPTGKGTSLCHLCYCERPVWRTGSPCRRGAALPPRSVSGWQAALVAHAVVLE